MINLMVRFACPDDVSLDAECECDKCERKSVVSQALDIDLSEQTLCIADEIPAGACPHCADGLVYVME